MEQKVIYDARNDQTYSRPYIDCDELRWRQVEFGNKIEYHYYHGGFEGTGVKFSFCFPLKEKFEYRFYQHLSPFPGPDEELAALEKTGEEDFIGFALTHGAAYVESNMGSTAVFGSANDSSIFYKSSAAVAEYCRTKAKELYGEKRVYGYVYGGSGGGYKTMSCIENTCNFDGALPYVIGSPVSLPNCLTVGAYGSRVLRNCWQKIIDAAEAGGSGDIYAGLTEDEKSALREILCMGYPIRMCSAFGSFDDGSLPVLAPTVQTMDPTYFTDFWEKPGYLGYERESNAARDRICMRTKVISAGVLIDGKKVMANDDRNGTDDAWQKMMSDATGAFIEVESVPMGEDLYLHGVDIIFESGKSKGKCLRLKAIEGNRLIPGMSFGADDYKEVITGLETGDEILLDNSDYIAIQSYHRHQVPEDKSYWAWTQFCDEKGNPKVPQRDCVISYGFTAGGCGSIQDGHIQGKVMVMNSLMDSDWPWQADWYRRKVKEVLGEKASQMFRIYYNDNSPHGDVSEGGDMCYVVSYLGMLRQALLDLAQWVENDITPIDSTGYTIVDNQVVLEAKTDKRGGLQPNVKLYANDVFCAHVKTGEEVLFHAVVEIPKGAGEFVSAEFSFEGEQNFPYKDCNVIRQQEEESENSTTGVHNVCVKNSHIYTEPGTYFAVVRVVSNRNPKDGYTRLRNLARVRVVVE